MILESSTSLLPLEAAASIHELLNVVVACDSLVFFLKMRRIMLLIVFIALLIL